jgi:methylated-DNA-[protein]-cysteine S-methyltransferase
MNDTTVHDTTVHDTTVHDTSTERTYAATIGSPVGDLVIVVTDRALRAVLWADEDAREPPIDGAVHVSPDDHPVLRDTVDQLGEYFDGRRTEFDLPLDPVGTPFQLAVWNVLRTIPYGDTLTYGEQAARLGDPNKARAVGAANGRNPISIVVPCHRVVGSSGKLTGFGGGLDAKAWLLDHERFSPPA